VKQRIEEIFDQNKSEPDFTNIPMSIKGMNTFKSYQNRVKMQEFQQKSQIITGINWQPLFQMDPDSQKTYKTI